MADIANVFVSYAHSDAIIANEIEQQLTFLADKGRGRTFLRCFLDSKSIPAGQRSGPILEAALKQADWLIVVYTGDLSPYCGLELGIYGALRQGESSVVCLHDVGKSTLPAMLDGYRTVEVSELSPHTSYDAIPSEKEVDLWAESPVGKFLREFCNRTELYTPKDHLAWGDYAVDIATAAKKIAGSFQLAQQDDEVSETSLQPVFDITIGPSFGGKQEGISENSVLAASRQTLAVFGLAPPLSLNERLQITWGELRHALSGGREDTSWMDQLEINIDRATSGLAPETDDVTFRGRRDDRIYRAILTQQKLLKNGEQRFSVLLSGTSTTPETSHPPKEANFLYATNRKRSFDESCFSGERADEISYGTASVQIPKAHKMGAVELPFSGRRV
jgi:hypothetical protein